MSPDLLIKLVAIPAIPVMLSLVYFVTGAVTDQSPTKGVASGQRESLRDVAPPSQKGSFHNADKSEDGLKANPNKNSSYAKRVSYFDYAKGIDLAKKQLITQLGERDGNQLSILNANYSKENNRHTDVFGVDGIRIEEKGNSFENVFWGGTSTGSGGYFSGLSDFNNLTGGDTKAPSSCQPYSEIQKLRSQLKSEQLNSAALGSRGEGSNTGKKLVDPKNLNALSPLNKAQDSELDIMDLVDAIPSTQPTEMAIAKTSTLDDCFIAQAKMIFDSEQIAMAPTKQMPNLTYYNYLFSTTETRANIGDGSASYFLFRKTEASPAEIEKRERLYQTARQGVSKWNAF